MTNCSLTAGCVAGLLLSFFTLHKGYAQSSGARVEVDLNPPIDPNPISQPEFTGSFGTLSTYLREQVQYPATAAQANIKGFVLVSFLIDTVGNVTNIRLLKGIGYGCDEEALRIIRQMPRWKPAQQAGKAVPAKYAIPVRFPPK